MDRIQRLMFLLTRLQTGEECEANTLAAELAVSRRTVFRDLQLLRTVGVPLSHDRSRSSYRLDKGYFFAPVALDRQEAWSLLLLARSAMTGSYHPDPTALGVAARKIMASLPREVRDSCVRELKHVECHPHPSTDGRRVQPLIRTLCRACADCEQVHVAYEDEDGQLSKITLCPLKVAFLHTEWFVAGTVVKPKATVLLKLDRIASIGHTNRKFVARKHFCLNDVVGQAWRHRPERRVYRVIIDCEPSVAEEVESICWHQSQRTTRDPNGMVRFEAEVDGLEEISRWVLGFGGRVVVREPPELIRRVTQAARKILASYAAEVPGDRVSILALQAMQGGAEWCK